MILRSKDEHIKRTRRTDYGYMRVTWGLHGGKSQIPGIANPLKSLQGEVPERLNGLVLKTSVRESVPWVRIPPSPPATLKPHKYKDYIDLWASLFSVTTHGNHILFSLD
jgi:hypothetical protein